MESRRLTSLLLGAGLVVAAVLIGSGARGWVPWVGWLLPAATAAAFPVAAWCARRSPRLWDAAQLVGLTLVIAIPVAFGAGLITGVTRDGMFFETAFQGRAVLAALLLAGGLASCTHPLWHVQHVPPAPTEPAAAGLLELLPAFLALTLGSGVVALVAAVLIADLASGHPSSTGALAIPFGAMLALVAAAAGWAVGAIGAAAWRSSARRPVPAATARPWLVGVYVGIVAAAATFGFVATWLAKR